MIFLFIVLLIMNGCRLRWCWKLVLLVEVGFVVFVVCWVVCLDG